MTLFAFDFLTQRRRMWRARQQQGSLLRMIIPPDNPDGERDAEFVKSASPDLDVDLFIA